LITLFSTRLTGLTGWETLIRIEKPRFDRMIDLEKIVVEICRRKREGASGRELLQWTRLSRERLVTALEENRDRVFSLTPDPEDPSGYRVALVCGPELAAIIAKYAEILGYCAERCQ
jgi:hypothetical protein